MKLFLSLYAFLFAGFACADERWNAPNLSNPILPGYYADPSLLQDRGQFYIYATIDPWGGRTLGCWQSTDFKTWTFRKLNWPTKEACTSANSHDSMVWAPSVVRGANGKFYMFVSVGSEVWVGTADHPLGPWRDAHGGKPLISAKWNPTYHMIDAEVFLDEDGGAYLYWGSGWDWKNGHCFAVKLNPDMVSFNDEPKDVTPVGHYFEGPFMMKNKGIYYLMYSDGITMSDTYSIHYSTGPSPLGPFTEAPNSPILSTDKSQNIISPGHHAVFRYQAATYILYHRHRLPFVNNTAFRQVCVDELHFSEDGLLEKVHATHEGPAFVHGRGTGKPTSYRATASSSLDSQHAAGDVVDDNYATRWEAAAHDPSPWLQLEFPENPKVARFNLRFEYAWKTYRFVLQSSVDAIHWETMEDFRGEGISGSPIVIEKPGRYRYVRLLFPPATEDLTPSLFEWGVDETP